MLQDLITEPSWKDLLEDEFKKPYFLDLRKFLESQRVARRKIYPPQKQIFNALNLTPFEQVKVVILGQDPYHGPGQAHGLSFSVRGNTPLPPSLKNILKEIQAEFGFKAPKSGDLTQWAKQGVLLLNATLTVEEGKAGSHQNRGWEHFTDRIIQLLNERRKGLVFVLWGSFAQKKAEFIDKKRHLILKSVHPSPLSANRGFFGNAHFSKANQYLKSKGIAAIDWNLTR